MNSTLKFYFWELSLATFTVFFGIAPKLRNMHFATDFVVITTFIMSADLNADAPTGIDSI